MRQVDPNPDFILLLGDTSAHFLTNWTQNVAIIRNITQTVSEYFPRAVIVPVIGNHIKRILLTFQRKQRCVSRLPITIGSFFHSY